MCILFNNRDKNFRRICMKRILRDKRETISSAFCKISNNGGKKPSHFCEKHSKIITC